jgi:DNA-binding NarL/FixJ family response regulator
MTASPCRVVLVSETRFYRECLARFLALAEGIEVLGTTRDVADAAVLAEGDEPVIVLVDVARPSEVSRVRLIRALAKNTQVLVLGVPEHEDTVLAYAEEGIVGFVGRDRSLDALVRAIERAANGELECSPAVSAALLRHVGRLAAEQRRAPGGAVLTGREHEIVLLIERGLSNKEIAQELRIELATVKNHVHNLLEKLDVTSRGQAAALVRVLPPAHSN